MGILERPDGEVEITAGREYPLGTTRASVPTQVRQGALTKGDERDESDTAVAKNRRERRYQLREVARSIAPGALRGCGRTMLVVNERVEVKINDGVGHFTGLATCGSVWMCPVCEAKIRHKRALMVERWLNQAFEMGHGVEFVTLTCRHWLGQALADLFSRSQKAFHGMRMQRAFRDLMARFELRWIMVREVLHGPINGWHPHFHLAVITWTPLTDTERAELEDGFWRGWSHQLQGVGLSALRGPGVLIKPCTSRSGLAEYLCKVVGDDARPTRGLALELTRGDLKTSKTSLLRTPEQILSDFADTGDQADRALYREYCIATKARRMMTITKGLKQHLSINEPDQTDEELATAEVGGETLLRMGRTAWGRVVALDLRLHLLVVAETSGRAGLRALMTKIAPDDFWYIVQPPETVHTEGENAA